MRDSKTPHDVDKFLEQHRCLRAEIRSRSESENANLLHVRRDILFSIIRKENLARGKTCVNHGHRMYLIAQYLLGVDLSYTAIVEGLYPQAANLQKQQIETLAQLEKVKDGKRPDKKDRNVRHAALPGISKLYGNLNEAAHPWRPEVVEALMHHESENGSGPCADPRYEREICETLLGNHCVCLMYLWRHMANLFDTEFEISNTTEENNKLDAAIKSLNEMGFISIKQQA